MSDEITQPPAVTEDGTAVEPIPDAVEIVDSLATPNWEDLTDSQKIDILHRKVDLIGQNVDWIGKTFQGVINMVGSISPMDLFKMMRGGK